MFLDTIFRRIIFNLVLIFVFLIIYVLLFYKIYLSDTIIISFVVTPFNICEKFPELWEKLKIFYIVITAFSSLIYINITYPIIFTKKKIHSKTSTNPNGLNLFIANNASGNPIILPESSLYQNILITGTIGSGKTSSAMYPFTRQLIKYKYDDIDQKLGMLILDVKGNYYSQVQKYANHYKRKDDLIVIELRKKH